MNLMKTLRRRLAFLFVFALAACFASPLRALDPVPAHATARRATIQVVVAPDRPDWTYALGDAANFRVRVLADDAELNGVELRVKLGPEGFEKTLPPQALRPDLVISGGSMREPGFLRCIVEATVDGKTYRGLATAGFAPEKIKPTQTEPADFDAYWKKGLEELATVPMEAETTLLPESCTSDVDVFHVSFRTIGSPGPVGGAPRIFGILCVPKAPGKYPALLRVPGAGVRRYTGQVELAAAGAITLEIGIHGIPVTYPQPFYELLRYGALRDYPLFLLDDPQNYYYRRVILGCVRAVDFLAKQPAYDGKTMVVQGGSQGGFLAVATAALAPRVNMIAVGYPAYSDVTGYLHGRAGGWPHVFRAEKDGAQSRHATPEKIATTRYYDTVNFARRVRVPSVFMLGYNDEVCPPTSMYAAYNTIAGPKKMILTLKTGHPPIPEGDALLREEVLAALGLGK